MENKEQRIMDDNPDKMICGRKNPSGLLINWGILIVCHIALWGYSIYLQVNKMAYVALVIVVFVSLSSFYKIYLKNRSFILDKEGITICSCFQKDKKYTWDCFSRIGVQGTYIVSPRRNGGPQFFVVCAQDEKSWKEWKINTAAFQYSPEAYERFLTYVPEGMVTDPPNEAFYQEYEKWKKIRNE